MLSHVECDRRVLGRGGSGCSPPVLVRHLRRLGALRGCWGALFGSLRLRLPCLESPPSSAPAQLLIGRLFLGERPTLAPEVHGRSAPQSVGCLLVLCRCRLFSMLVPVPSPRLRLAPPARESRRGSLVGCPASPAGCHGRSARPQRCPLSRSRWVLHFRRPRCRPPVRCSGCLS